MANYIINYRNGGANANVTIAPGQSPNLAGLNLMGQNYANYGQNLNQNWVSIAENFASNATIANPVTGQLWYTSGNLKLNTGSQISPTWQTVVVSDTSGNITVNNLTTTNSITSGSGIDIISGPMSVFNGNLDITGNINVTGNLNYSNVSSLVIGDPLIYLGANNTGDIVDLGIVSSYNIGSNVYTGIARNAVTDYWTFYDGVATEPTTTIDWANATYPTVKLGNLVATGTLNATGNANVGNIGATGAVFTTITGTLSTAAQPNITSVGTLVSLTTTTITTGGNTVPGTITGNWTLTTGSKLEATYADLAEYYRADGDIESGTVVDFGGEAEVTTSNTDMSTRVAGVVSTEPAYVMNGNLSSKFRTCLTLQGRVPCKVIGYIHKGDMLVSAGNGYARSESNPVLGSVIGKALEHKQTAEAGIIEIAVGRC